MERGYLMANISKMDDETPGWDDLFTILEQTSDPALKHAIGKINPGRPVTFTNDIGGFICYHISEGLTLNNIIDLYNEIEPESPLTRSKIYSWLNNVKLLTFRKQYYYARELSTNGILDDIIDLENDISSDTVSFKSGRVVLESKRWRAKIQNPDYFNPVDKTEANDKREIIIKAYIPVPLPLPDQLRINNTDDEAEVIDGEVEDTRAEDRGASAVE